MSSNIIFLSRCLILSLSSCLRCAKSSAPGRSSGSTRTEVFVSSSTCVVLDAGVWRPTLSTAAFQATKALKTLPTLSSSSAGSRYSDFMIETTRSTRSAMASARTWFLVSSVALVKAVIRSQRTSSLIFVEESVSIVFWLCRIPSFIAIPKTLCSSDFAPHG